MSRGRFFVIHFQRLLLLRFLSLILGSDSSTLRGVKPLVIATNMLAAPTEITEFCQRWDITELALFGSVLRNDFEPESDIDVLVDFAEDAQWGLLDHVQMQQDLEGMLGRKVDLISKRALQESVNWIRREAILNSAEIIYQERGIPYAA